MLEQLAYAAQIVGVGLVVASLVYVGRQVQQNTETMRQNAAGYYLGLQERLCGEVAGSREFAQQWLKAATDFDSLDDVDKQRVMLFEWRAFTGWNQLFQLRRNGLVPDSQWHELLWSMKNFGSRKSAGQAWSVFKGAFEEQFQDFVSGHIMWR